MPPPHQAGWTARGGKIHQLDQRAILDHCRRLTPFAARPLSDGLDTDPDRAFRIDVLGTKDVGITESDTQLAHGDRVGVHGDSHSERVDTVRLTKPLPCSRNRANLPTPEEPLKARRSSSDTDPEHSIAVSEAQWIRVIIRMAF